MFLKEIRIVRYTLISSVLFHLSISLVWCTPYCIVVLTYLLTFWNSIMKLINLAKKMLLKNAYPQKFIDKCIQNFFNKMFIQIMFRIVREKKFVTSVLRNGTFGEVYTNFISFIPLEYKFGLVHTLLNCCFNLSSDFLKVHHEVTKLKKNLSKNAYSQVYW